MSLVIGYKMKPYLLNIKQFEKKLKPWRDLSQANQIKGSWLKLIRETLGISSSYLAHKMGVTQPNITQLEQAETAETITIKTLKNLAHQLDCDLVYAIVPREPINQMLEKRARTIAKKQLDIVAHTMFLEDQSLNKEDLKERYEEMVKELLTGHPKYLWKEDYD
jgi:predicted DNA-binding mobile mystery protein A